MNLIGRAIATCAQGGQNASPILGNLIERGTQLLDQFQGEDLAGIPYQAFTGLRDGLREVAQNDPKFKLKAVVIAAAGLAALRSPLTAMVGGAAGYYLATKLTAQPAAA
jgi:hypothetical protein